MTTREVLGAGAAGLGAGAASARVRRHAGSRPSRGWRLINLLPALLASIAVACPASVAEAQSSCQIEEAQRLFGQQPRPTTEVERLLKACQAGGSADYRVYMLLGVMARDAGNRKQAIDYLRKAHELAPEAPNPALELGFTLEAGRPKEARKVYEQVLRLDPNSRPAMLGLARVARGQNRLDAARALYQRLLTANPKDPDALNGMAWLALANRDRTRAQAGFAQVLAIAPNNEEATIGLSKTAGVYRYQLEASGIGVSTAQGVSMGFQARATAGVTAFDTLELGWRHFDNELATVSSSGFAILPSDDITLGYHRLAPLSYAVSLVYDYRGHAGLPTEHWIDSSVALYASDRVQWFAGYRQAFGGAQYDGRLFRTGFAVSVAPAWQVTATVYDSQQANFRHYRDLWSWTVDVTYFGPHNMQLSVGGGASPLIDNVDLHARATLPVVDRIALQIVAAHNSTNSETSVTAGPVFAW